MRDAVNPVSVAVCQLQLNEYRKCVNSDAMEMCYCFIMHTHTLQFKSFESVRFFVSFLKEMIFF